MIHYYRGYGDKKAIIFKNSLFSRISDKTYYNIFIIIIIIIMT